MEPERDYYLTQAAARFLQSVAPDIVSEVPAYRFRLLNTPRARQALAQALETARSRGVKSSLRAALRRFDPEAVPTPAAAGERTGGRLFVLWKPTRGRTYKVEGTATSEGSLGTVVSLIRSAEEGRGRLRVILARTAADARAKLAAFESGSERPGIVAGLGSDSDPKLARVLGIGAPGALAVWRAIGPDARGARTGTGAALEPTDFERLTNSDNSPE